MRQHSIKSTYLIHKTLVENDEITTLIPEENIFLLQALPDTLFPYAVITRTGIKSERGNKDFIGDIVTFNIKVFSDKYNIGVDIADAIRLSIENYILSDELIKMENITLISSKESIYYDTFIQEMDFSAEVSRPSTD